MQHLPKIMRVTNAVASFPLIFNLTHEQTRKTLEEDTAHEYQESWIAIVHYKRAKNWAVQMIKHMIVK